MRRLVCGIALAATTGITTAAADVIDPYSGSYYEAFSFSGPLHPVPIPGPSIGVATVSGRLYFTGYGYVSASAISFDVSGVPYYSGSYDFDYSTCYFCFGQNQFLIAPDGTITQGAIAISDENAITNTGFGMFIDVLPYLSSFDTRDPDGTSYQLVAGADITPEFGIVYAPEPWSVAVLGIGLLGLVGARRKLSLVK